MSQPIDDGGPAYPHAPFALDGRHWSDGSQGMTLRDWFAGQALAGMMADGKNSGRFADIASDAWDFADAMLAARKGGQP